MSQLLKACNPPIPFHCIKKCKGDYVFTFPGYFPFLLNIPLILRPKEFCLGFTSLHDNSALRESHSIFQLLESKAIDFIFCLVPYLLKIKFSVVIVMGERYALPGEILNINLHGISNFFHAKAKTQLLLNCVVPMHHFLSYVIKSAMKNVKHPRHVLTPKDGLKIPVTRLKTSHFFTLFSSYGWLHNTSY